MAHPEVNYREPIVSFADLRMYRIYRVVYKPYGRTVQLVGQLVDYKFVDGQMCMIFRTFDSTPPRHTLIRTSNLRRATITHITDYVTTED